MKMVMIVVDEAKKEELEVVLEQAGIVGYTELGPASGLGTTGWKLGSRAFPRSSAVVFSVLEPAALSGLAAQVKTFCADCGERLRIVAWEIEEVL